MAVTKILARHDNSIHQLIEYIADPSKTIRVTDETEMFFEGETVQYVTGVNCEWQTAADAMYRTKNRFHKNRGVVVYHAWQSFKYGEVSAETAHQIGVELAQKLWGEGFEVVVGTHLDKGHYHNHFAVNSVSFADGSKNRAVGWPALRKLSDELCREYNLSIVRNPQFGRTVPYSEYLMQQKQKPNLRSVIRQDIDRLLPQSKSLDELYRKLMNMGYQVETSGKYVRLKSAGMQRYVRLQSLGAGYTPDELAGKTGRGNARGFADLRGQHTAAAARPKTHKRLRASTLLRQMQPHGGLVGLYYHYCYALGVFQRKPPRTPPKYRKYLRQADKFSAEAKLLTTNRLHTMPELEEYISGLDGNIETLSTEQSSLRLALRKQPEDQALQLQLQEIRSQLKELRKEARLCVDIRKRSRQAQQNRIQLPPTQQQVEIEQEKARQESERKQKNGREI